MCSLIHSLAFTGDSFHPLLRRHNLHQRRPFALHRSFESLAYGVLSLAYRGHGVHALTCHIACALQLCGNLCYLQWVSVQFRHTTVRACRGFLSQQCGGGHLSARHAIDSVVDEYNRYVLASVQRMYGLASTYACQVAVALIREDEPVGPHPFDGCSHCWCPSVGSLRQSMSR